MRKRYILGPLVAFVTALIVFVVLITTSLQDTNHHEHIDSTQIVKIERYINKQVAQSKTCSIAAVNSSPISRVKCEKTINGIIASVSPIELRLLGKALAPYVEEAK